MLDDNIGEIAIRHSIRDLLCLHLKISTYTPVEITLLKKPLHPGFIESINRHDLCIIGGGGLYSKYFLPMNTRVLDSIEIPIVLYGPGYIRNFGDGELTGEQKRTIRLLNARAELTSVRDYLSFRFLSGLGIKDAYVIGDPAIFLDHQEVNQLGLGDDRVKVGVNLACHFWTGYPRYLYKTIAECIKACELLVDSSGAEIVYLMHHPDERLAVELMEKKLPIKVADTGLNPHEMKFIYGKLDLVIGMMMHSAVLAFGSGIPVVNIAYDVKNYGFMEFIGQEDKVIDVREVDHKKIGGLAMRTLEDSKEIREKFKLLKHRLLKKQEKFVTKIGGIVNSS